MKLTFEIHDLEYVLAVIMGHGVQKFYKILNRKLAISLTEYFLKVFVHFYKIDAHFLILTVMSFPNFYTMLSVLVKKCIVVCGSSKCLRKEHWIYQGDSD